MKNPECDPLPCTIRLLRVPKPVATFHDFGDFEALVESAGAIDAEAHLIVLLAGEAGLRCGEIIALEWADVDLAKRPTLCAAGRLEW